MDAPVKVLLISNAITLLVLLAKIIWDMTRSESRDLTVAMKENTEQIIELAAAMKFVCEELKKIPELAHAVAGLERTVAIHVSRLERLDQDFREFRKDYLRKPGRTT